MKLHDDYNMIEMKINYVNKCNLACIFEKVFQE